MQAQEERSGVIHIEDTRVQDLLDKAGAFLDRIKPLLFTNECQFMQSEKNIQFDRMHPLKHEEKVRIIKSLRAEDCIKIEPNNNARYANSEIYAFTKDCILTVYGEDETIKLYIKMYLTEKKDYDIVIVISFHQEGMHN